MRNVAQNTREKYFSNIIYFLINNSFIVAHKGNIFNACILISMFKRKFSLYSQIISLNFPTKSFNDSLKLVFQIAIQNPPPTKHLITFG